LTIDLDLDMTLQAGPFVVLYHCSKFHQNVSIGSMFIKHEIVLPLQLTLTLSLTLQAHSSLFLSITLLSFIEKY
jgi:hypothetical protein